jgi:simple sugar transport system permease protein
VVTILLIAILCIFTTFFAKTKLGQDFRTVGQDRHIATVSGIHSDNTRLLAMILSTTLASWGHIIFLQNLGTFSTYGSHEQIGLFSVAALLIGGASVTNAKISHALLGTFLFHTLFIVSPLAGRNLFGDAQLGEYFRAFVAYGVIGLSLVMHAWRKQIEKKRQLSA